MTTFSNIMNKLKAVNEYPNFIRHINGDTLDNRIENLTWVTLREAFANLDWKVDWVCYVTEEERDYIKNMLAPRA